MYEACSMQPSCGVNAWCQVNVTGPYHFCLQLRISPAGMENSQDLMQLYLKSWHCSAYIYINCSRTVKYELFIFLALYFDNSYKFADRWQ